jgi:Concanavalin A-like lectin/glucanases superfamily/Secretion system C-terminal sorting domain/Fibronectin type III domain
MKILYEIGKRNLFIIFFLIISFGYFPQLFSQSFHLHFNADSSQYVQLEDNPPQFGAQSFTIEIWFNWTGSGSTAYTGGVTAIPLLTKGTGESGSDGTNRDMNYFLGIDNTGANPVLAADFEEGGAPSPNPGANYPITGNTTITTSTWHHAAFTYDASTGKLSIYLDGILDSTRTLAAGIIPQYLSIQPAAIGSALSSTSVAGGFFDGELDEARIWNTARTQSQIQLDMSTELSSPYPSSLIGYWKLNDGVGTSATNELGSPNGTLVGTPYWLSGNFSPPLNAPGDPLNLTADSITCGGIHLSWTDTSAYETYFKIERSINNGPFTEFIELPANTTSYNDLNLTPATSYQYQVRAWNIGGLSGYTNTAGGTTSNEGTYALEFNGSSDYVTFGKATKLNCPNFTVETWFKVLGPGVATNTSTPGSGIYAVPLVTKGMAEDDNSGDNVNYFLGITTLNHLTSDFEAISGENHPIAGTTSISNNTWYHAAVTYNDTSGAYVLYLNDNIEKDTTISTFIIPDSTTTQFAALATALGTNGQIPSGQTQGFFNGILDEVRIWNRALTQTEIQINMQGPITTPTANLIGRWGLNETGGFYANGGAGTTTAGTLVGSPSWVASDNPFPVELVSFSGNFISNKVELNWQTATEVNNYGFEIQRLVKSVDNNSNRRKIGFVFGNGNSNSPKNYSFIDNNIEKGKIIDYRLKQIDNDGKYEYSKTIEITTGIPNKFALSQNYPNPFNPVTIIKYSIPKESDVTIKIYDVLGNEIQTLISGKQASGVYTINFDGSKLASGLYFYVLNSNSIHLVKKMLILK